MAKTIPLTRGFAAVVDDEDFEMLSSHRWRVKLEGRTDTNEQVWPYAVSQERVNGKQRESRMHRLIAGAEPGRMVDHKNGDTLDNRRANLRLTDNSGNQANRRKRSGLCASPYKGVTWDKGASKWKASIRANGRMRYLGLFADEQKAAKAYDKAARELRGDFALLNFPKEDAKR